MDVPVPVPACCRALGKGKREVVSRRRVGSVGCADEMAGGGEGGEPLAEGGVPDATGAAELSERDGLARFGEGPGDALVHRGRRQLGWRRPFEHFQCQGVAVLHQLEGDGRDEAAQAAALVPRYNLHLSAFGVEVRRVSGLERPSGAPPQRRREPPPRRRPAPPIRWALRGVAGHPPRAGDRPFSIEARVCALRAADQWNR